MQPNGRPNWPLYSEGSLGYGKCHQVSCRDPTKIMVLEEGRFICMCFTAASGISKQYLKFPSSFGFALILRSNISKPLQRRCGHGACALQAEVAARQAEERSRAKPGREHGVPSHGYHLQTDRQPQEPWPKLRTRGLYRGV